MPLALLGIVLSVQAWPGIRAAEGVTNDWRRLQDELLATSWDLQDYSIYDRDSETGELSEDHSVAESRRRRQGERFATYAPWAFGIMWVYLFLLALMLYLTE